MDMPVSDTDIQHTLPVRIIRHYPAFIAGYAITGISVTLIHCNFNMATYNSAQLRRDNV
jgi:hypothetical protein